MLILAFDTATAAVTVGVCEWTSGESVRTRAESKIVDRRRHAEVLSPTIVAVLDEAGATLPDLSVIAVGVGPGPYTGLRVGLATARALGDVLKIPVHGVCTLDAIAWESGRGSPFVVATDARRKEVYWARYDSARSRVDGPAVGKPADAAAYGLPVLGEGGPAHPEVFADAAAPPTTPSAAALAEPVAVGLAGGAAPPLPPSPLYLRLPDARAPGPRKRVTPP